MILSKPKDRDEVTANGVTLLRVKRSKELYNHNTEIIESNMRVSAYIIFIGILLTAGAFVSTDNSIQLDGILNDNEWKNAKEYRLSGGGKLLIKKENKELYIAMAGDKQAWAHVYLYSLDTIRVMHASAALGEAKYIRQNDLWRSIETFQWALREKEYNDELVRKQQDHYQKHGWVANNNNMGNGMTFEFKLNLSHPDPVYFACVLAQVPLELSYFPGSLSDNTILPKLVQGYTPDSLQFDPALWEKAN